MARKPYLRSGRVVATITTIIAAGSVFPGTATAAETCKDARLRPTTSNQARVATALTCLINNKRAAKGLRKMRVDPRLRRAARRHSSDMVRRGYFAHVSQNGATVTDRAKRAGYLRKARSWWLAENLAYGSGSLSSAKAILKSWLNSPPHRANMLSREARDAGIGIARGAPQPGQSGATFTLMLGRRN